MPLARLERLLQTGAYYQVRREADRLLQEEGLPPEALGRVLNMACRACLALQDPYAAVRFGKQALKLALEAGDAESRWRAHLDLGSAMVEVGDTYGAESHLTAFLDLMQVQPEASRWEGLALVKLATLYRQQRRWHEAIAALERAQGSFEAQDEPGEATRAALELAWCYLMLGLPALAAPLLRPAEAYLGANPAADLSAELICRKALLSRLGGDLVTSSRLCQEILLPGRPGTTYRHMAEAAWILGENALSLDRLPEARAFGDQALTYASEANWPSLINLANDLRLRALSHVASPEE